MIAAITLLTRPALAENAKLSDPQIAHIAYTAGVIDVAAGKQGMAKASNNEVKAFAENMVRDHEAVNKLALDLVKKLNITPEENDTSNALSKQAADKLVELGKLSRVAKLNNQVEEEKNKTRVTQRMSSSMPASPAWIDATAPRSVMIAAAGYSRATIAEIAKPSKQAA